MSFIWAIRHVDVYPTGVNEYQVYAEAWIEDRIQVSPATWEEPAEHRPGLCSASTYVEDRPPTNAEDLEEYIHELNRGNSLDWVDVDPTDI